MTCLPLGGAVAGSMSARPGSAAAHYAEDPPPRAGLYGASAAPHRRNSKRPSEFQREREGSVSAGSSCRPSSGRAFVRACRIQNNRAGSCRKHAGPSATPKDERSQERSRVGNAPSPSVQRHTPANAQQAPRGHRLTSRRALAPSHETLCCKPAAAPPPARPSPTIPLGHRATWPRPRKSAPSTSKGRIIPAEALLGAAQSAAKSAAGAASAAALAAAAAAHMARGTGLRWPACYAPSCSNPYVDGCPPGTQRRHHSTAPPFPERLDLTGSCIVFKQEELAAEAKQAVATAPPHWQAGASAAPRVAKSSRSPPRSKSPRGAVNSPPLDSIASPLQLALALGPDAASNFDEASQLALPLLLASTTSRRSLFQGGMREGSAAPPVPSMLPASLVRPRPLRGERSLRKAPPADENRRCDTFEKLAKLGRKLERLPDKHATSQLRSPGKRPLLGVRKPLGEIQPVHCPYEAPLQCAVQAWAPCMEAGPLVRSSDPHQLPDVDATSELPSLSALTMFGVSSAFSVEPLALGRLKADAADTAATVTMLPSPDSSTTPGSTSAATPEVILSPTDRSESSVVAPLGAVSARPCVGERSHEQRFQEPRTPLREWGQAPGGLPSPLMPMPRVDPPSGDSLSFCSHCTASDVGGSPADAIATSPAGSHQPFPGCSPSLLLRPGSGTGWRGSLAVTARLCVGPWWDAGHRPTTSPSTPSTPFFGGPACVANLGANHQACVARAQGVEASRS